MRELQVSIESLQVLNRFVGTLATLTLDQLPPGLTRPGMCQRRK